MNIQRPKNTKENGIIEGLVYKEGNIFVGVCLSFDIVEEGSNPIELMKSIREASELHLETVIKNNLPDELLNRYAPEEYWIKYFETAKEIENPLSTDINSLMRSPYQRSQIAEIA